MADKIYKCKYCPDGQSPQFEKLHQVGTHQRAEHRALYDANRAAKKQQRRDRAASNSGVTEPEETDAPTPELEVLTNCVEWLEAGKLTWSAAHRVLRYLEDRFAPATVVTCIAGNDGAHFDVLDRETVAGARLAAIANEPGASGATTA